MNRVRETIDRARVVVCCGSGGVGKTTVSAAMGLYAAITGKKTLVMTIDPAKRLADALGLSSFDHNAQPVPKENLNSSGITVKGSLFAMMPDTRRMFDILIDRYAPSTQVRDRIYSNRYYRHLSSTIAGSHEYMAMEKLYELREQNQYDLIVMDTPPTRHALDFLEAPDRVVNLLGNPLFRKILKPYVHTGIWGIKMAAALAAPMQKVIKNLMGLQVLHDLADFFQMGDDMFYDGFKKRAAATRQILSEPDTAFFAVSGPMPASVKESLFFCGKLKSYHMPFDGFIVNRVHPLYPDVDLSDIRKRMADAGDAALAEKLIANYADLQKLGASDREGIQIIREAAGDDLPVVEIPCFRSDVYDLKGLMRVVRWISEDWGQALISD